MRETKPNYSATTTRTPVRHLEYVDTTALCQSGTQLPPSTSYERPIAMSSQQNPLERQMADTFDIPRTCVEVKRNGLEVHLWLDDTITKEDTPEMWYFHAVGPCERTDSAYFIVLRKYR